MLCAFASIVGYISPRIGERKEKKKTTEKGGKRRERKRKKKESGLFEPPHVPLLLRRRMKRQERDIKRHDGPTGALARDSKFVIGSTS